MGGGAQVINVLHGVLLVGGRAEQRLPPAHTCPQSAITRHSPVAVPGTTSQTGYLSSGDCSAGSVITIPLGQICLRWAMGLDKTAVSFPKRQVSTLARIKHYIYYFEFEVRVFLISFYKIFLIHQHGRQSVKTYTIRVIFIFEISKYLNCIYISIPI